MFLQFFEGMITLFLFGWEAWPWMMQFCILIIFPMLQCCNGVTFSKLYGHLLYVCIILETAHHRTTFGIFCNITHRLYLKK